MEEKKDAQYMAYELCMARMERANFRLWILLIITLFLLFATNIAWYNYESQFEDVVTTVTQDLETSGSGNAIINDGVHINGESETNGKN